MQTDGDPSEKKGIPRVWQVLVLVSVSAIFLGACRNPTEQVAGRAETAGPPSSDRRLLSESYRRSGFDAAADFYDRSILVEEKNPWTEWRCSIKEDPCGEAPDLYQSPEARTLQSLIFEGRLDEAMAIVHDVMRDDAKRCRWEVEWADLIRLQSMWDPESVSAVDRDKAIGVLIQSAESSCLPLGPVSRSDLFISLAQYFGTMGDRTSAITAYRVARDLSGESDVPDFARPDVVRSIDEGLSRLGAE